MVGIDNPELTRPPGSIIWINTLTMHGIQTYTITDVLGIMHIIPMAEHAHLRIMMGIVHSRRCQAAGGDTMADRDPMFIALASQPGRLPHSLNSNKASACLHPLSILMKPRPLLQPCVYSDRTCRILSQYQYHNTLR
jgi:hypothetical protein